MDGSMLNPSMLMIIAVQESEYAYERVARAAAKSETATASKNTSNRVGVTPREAH